MQSRLVAAEARLVAAQDAVVAGKQALEDQQDLVKDLVVSLYQQGDPTLVSLSGYLGAQSPSDVIRHEEYANSATDKQKGIFDDLTAAEVLLRAREGEVEAARDDVADRRADAAANLTAMQRLTDQTEAAKRVVYGRSPTTRSNQQAARAARQHDLQMLRDLKKEEAKIKRQLLAAIAAAAAAERCRLHRRVGRVPRLPGQRARSPRRTATGSTRSTATTACTTAPTSAPAAGRRCTRSPTARSISAYYSSVYGNRLYVNLGKVNGHNLTANYNHATSYTVGVGDHVTRGQVVGYVGSTGWSTGCHLHFTVLQDGDPVDPMGYM